MAIPPRKPANTTPVTRPSAPPVTASPSPPKQAIKLDPEKLKRVRPPKDEASEADREPPSISAGPVDKVIELAFNPTREKIREVTVIDRMQGRYFPQLDMINMMRHYLLEVAYYRQDSNNYARIFKKRIPVSPDALDEYLFRTAQWQKSVGGKNLERATDIALAETEAQGDNDGDIGGASDAWKD